MRKYLISCCFAVGFLAVHAQNNIEEEDQFDVFWTNISNQLETAPKESHKTIAIKSVEELCGNDYPCLHHNLNSVVRELEHQFNLPLAVEICLEIVDLAQTNANLRDQALAHRNLSRFYRALGNGYQGALHSDKATRLYGQIGDTPSVNLMKLWALENQLQPSNADSIFSELYDLLESTKAAGYEAKIDYFHKRLVWYCLTYEKYDAVLESVEALEAKPIV